MDTYTHTHDERREQRARRYVLALRSFYLHLILYAAVMALLFVIDWLGGPGWWFVWPLLGWGIGVAMHGISVFGIGGLFDEAWQERKTQEVLEQERR
jgi:fatty acid desaturase